MLRWIGLATIVVALVGVSTFFAMDSSVAEPTHPPAPVVPTGPAAKLELSEPPTYEFGIMSQLSRSKHTWEIKNVGEVDLELTMGDTTCSCTIAKLKGAEGEDKPKLIVKPHESTKVDVEWQTKTFHDDYSQGVKLITNDPTNALLSINVHGKIHPPIIVFPKEAIDLKSVSNEEVQGAKIAMFSMDRPETKILKISSSRPDLLSAKTEAFSADDISRLKCKAGHWIVFEIKPGMPLGRFQEELLVETDHPLKPEVNLTITGSMSGPISLIPEPRVRMPSVSSSQGATHDLTILVRGGTPTKFEVASHPEKINVQIVGDDTPTMKGRYKMTVTVPPGTSAGPVDGEIVLKTDHPRAGEIKIPVSVRISNLGAN